MSTSRVDAKRRVVLPRVRPGEVFEIQQQAEGRFLLTRLEVPVPSEPMNREACVEAIEAAPLELRMGWEVLRSLTREP